MEIEEYLIRDGETKPVAKSLVILWPIVHKITGCSKKTGLYPFCVYLDKEQAELAGIDYIITKATSLHEAAKKFQVVVIGEA